MTSGMNAAGDVVVPGRAMSRADVSVLVFGLYLFAEGLLLLLAPDLLLRVLGLPAALDSWPRAAGIACVVLALYYVLAVRVRLVAFYAFSVAGRLLQLVLFASVVAMGWMPALLLGPALVEAASGLWTLWALRRDAAGAVPGGEVGSMAGGRS
jgi:hypothetical protein